MPQMFPLMWVILFLIINSLIIIMMTTIHFSSKTPPLVNLPNKINPNSQPWKW